jgi:hypothetical protein
VGSFALKREKSQECIMEEEGLHFAAGDATSAGSPTVVVLSPF